MEIPLKHCKVHKKGYERMYHFNMFARKIIWADLNFKSNSL